MEVPRGVWTVAALGMLLMSFGLAAFTPPIVDSATLGRAEVGVTYSPREATFRNLSWQETFNAALDASPALVRLGVYWNEVESRPGTYDFSTIDWLLDQASARQQRVVLSVGMKAPRWPEYYLPDWLQRSLAVADRAAISENARVRAATRALLTATIEHLRGRHAIAAWQVENEPLDPAGPHAWRISSEFLSQEIALVRRLDVDRQRPVVVNMFVDTQPATLLPPARSATWNRANKLLATADVLGLDVYPSRTLHVLNWELTVRWPGWIWSGLLADLHDAAIARGKDAWIVEVQAEPWVSSGGRVPPAAWPGAGVAPSSFPGVMSGLEAAGYRTILLWGVEHWEAQRSHSQDPSWWAAANTFFERATS
jgi:hypothetical protein